MVRMEIMNFTLALPLLSLLLLCPGAQAFTVRPTRRSPSSLTSPLTLRETVVDSTSAPGSGGKRRRSRVTDPAGATKPAEHVEPETINLEDIEELHYDENKHPIPHQPWRRGETDGCEDPIDAEWRKEAEAIIKHAVESTRAKFVDVTWYLTAVIVSIDSDFSAMEENMLKMSGPPINIKLRQGRVYKHPDDPEPEELWLDDEIVFDTDDDDDDEPGMKSTKSTSTDEADKRPKKKPTMATGDALSGIGGGPGEEDPADLEVPPEYVSLEDRARKPQRDEQISDLEDSALQKDTGFVDHKKVSTIAGAILDSLETVESRLRILERHELVLTSPGSPFVIETQKDFDKYRGTNVAVDTEDPWESNRTIRGKLYNRNTLDVILSQNGRLVTIPNNFVRCVRRKADFTQIQPQKKVVNADANAEEEDDDDEEDDFDLDETEKYKF